MHKNYHSKYLKYKKKYFQSKLSDNSDVDKYQKISIHFLWISAPSSESNTVFIDKKYLSEIESNINKWIELNNNCEVNLWYDSRLYTGDGVIETTESYFGQVLGANFSVFKMRDIAQTAIVNRYKNLLDERLAILFRADLARFIIAYEVLNDNNRENINALFFYTDFNVVPVDIIYQLTHQPKCKKLFDIYSIAFMRYQGFFGGPHGFENKILMAKYDPVLLQTIDQIMFQRINSALETTITSCICLDKLKQFIYDYIPIFFAVLLNNKQRVTLSFTNAKGNINTDNNLYINTGFNCCNNVVDLYDLYNDPQNIMIHSNNNIFYTHLLIENTKRFYLNDNDFIEEALHNYQRDFLKINMLNRAIRDANRYNEPLVISEALTQKLNNNLYDQINYNDIVELLDANTQNDNIKSYRKKLKRYLPDIKKFNETPIEQTSIFNKLKNKTINATTEFENKYGKDLVIPAFRLVSPMSRTQ